MGFSKNITFLDEHLRSDKAEDFASLKLLREMRQYGYALTITGSFLAATTSYKFAYSTGKEDLENAFAQFTFPAKRDDIELPATDNLMYPIVVNAINQQAPRPRTQDVKFENGVFKLDAIPSDRKKINVEELNTDIRQEASSAIADYNYEYYLGIGGGVTIAIAGAFLLAAAGKSAHKMRSRYSKQITSSPAPPEIIGPD